MNKQTLILLCVFMTALLKGQTPTASFANWKDNKKAAYTIIHDDYSDYVTGIFQYADPIATARGVKLCFGAITGYCGTTEWNNAKTMISHGHECINHTHNHYCGGSASECSGLTTYGVADFGTELGQSTQLIESGTGVRPLFFIHPYDATSAAIESYLLGLGYIGARAGTQETYNSAAFTDFMHLNFYVWSPSSAFATLKNDLDATIAAEGYAVREFHGVADGSWGAMTVANYTSHLDYVKSQMDNGNVWSATASEAITYKMQRDAYQTAVVYTAATGQVNVNFSLKTGASINTANLKTPVTVNVNMGTTPTTNTYTASQNGSPVTVTRSGNVLSFNVYPHQGNVILNCTNCAPTAPIVGTRTQPSCSVATGSVVLSGLPAGSWTINPGNIAGSGTSTTVTGLAANATYNFTVTNASGTSDPSANVVINAQPVTPTAPTIDGIAQPSCSVATGSVVLGGLPSGDWTLNPGAITGIGTTKTLTGLEVGVYNYTVTNSVGCTSPPSEDVSFKAVSGTPSAPTLGLITQPSCSVSTGSVVLNGLPTGNWIINPGNISGAGVTTTISGLSAGTYNFTVTDVSGLGCVSTPSANIVINSSASNPTVGTPTVIQPSCSVLTGTIIANATGSGVLEYRLDNGAYQSSATFSGLTAGAHTVQVRTVGSSCVATATPVTVNAIVGAPTVGASTVTQPTCTVSTGTIVVNATGTNPLEYSLNNGAYQSSATFSGLTAGVYTVQARTVGSTCVGTGSPVTLNAITPAPSVGTSTITQPTCAVSTGTIVVNATGTGTLEYSLNNLPYQSSATFSNLTAGSYTVQARTVGATCIGTGTPVTINTIANAPVVGASTVTQPTCTVSIGTIVVNATGTNPLEYSLNNGTYQSSATFSNLTAGVYTVQARTVGSTCVGTGSPVTLNAITPAPSVGTSTVTQPTCAVSTGTIVVNATGTGTLEYSLNNLPYQSSATFSNLTAGSYTVQARTVGATCIGTGTPVTLNAIIGSPIVGTPTVTQPTCTVITGTIVVNATGTNPLEYSLNGGVYQSSATFSGLTGGTTYTVQARTVGSTCVGTGTSVTLDAIVAPPSVGTSTVTQPTCTVSTGTIVVNATGTGTLEYSLNNGAYQSSATFSNLTAGDYTVHARIVGATCIGTGTPITLNTVVPAPVVGVSTVTQPTCTVSTGTIVVNATGTGTLEYSLNNLPYQSSATFSGLTSGSYTVQARTVGSICAGTGTPVTLDAVAGAPVVGASTVTQPTCTVITGIIVVNATGTNPLEYSLNNGAYQSSATFSGLTSGVYTVQVRTVGSTCTGSGASVTLNSVTAAPVVSASTVTQPTCTVSTGTIVVNATGTGTLEYSLNNLPYQSSATFSGLTSGTYTVQARTVGSICAGTGTPVTLDAVAGAPVVGASTVTQPSCAVGTGTIVVNATGTNPLEYSLNNGAYQSSATFSGLTSGVYTVQVRTVGSTCTSSGASVTLNSVTAAPVISASTVTQPTCTVSTGTIVVNATGTGTLEYSLNNLPYQSSATFSNLTAGSYTVQARTVGSTCIGAGTTVTLNALAQAPIVSESTVTQPSCAAGAGTIVVNATGTNPLEYSLNNGTYQSNATFNGLTAGTYTVQARTVGSTCVGTGTAVTINAVAGAPSVGTSTVTQPSCTVSTGTIVVNATGTGILEYSLNNGTYQSSATFSGLTAGIYTIQVRTVGSTCIGTGTAVTINTSPSAPKIGDPTVTQPSCPSPTTGTIVVNATGIGTMEYSINGGTSYQSSATFVGLGIGTYNIAVRIVGTTCVGIGSAVTISAAPNTPSVSGSTVIQPGCTGAATGTIVVNATITSGTLEYSINGGTSYQNSATFSGLGGGTYNIVVRTVGTTCTATGSPVTINTALSGPSLTLPTVTQPSCPNQLTGTIVVNANTASGVLEYSINGGTTYQKTPIFNGLSQGTYTIAARIVGTTCVTLGSTVTINASPIIPIVAIPNVIQPACPSPTLGTIVVNASASAGTLEYSINGGLSYQSSPVFNDLGVGSYVVAARIVGTLCATVGTSVTINSPPNTAKLFEPEVIQPSCPSPSKGAIIINATAATVPMYSIDGGQTYYRSSSFYDLSPGSYRIVVRESGSGCMTIGKTIIINPAPNPPSVTAPTVTQPNCPSQPQGRIVVNASIATGVLEYSINGGTSYQSSNIFSGLNGGAYTVAARVVGTTCSTIGSTVTVSSAVDCCIPPTITAVNKASSCSNSQISINAVGDGILEYSIDNGVSYQTNPVFTGLSAGNYIIKVRIQSSPRCVANWGNNPVAISNNVNNPPVVSMLRPIIVAASANTSNITLSAFASDLLGAVRQVNFYQVVGNNRTLIGSDLTEPYTFVWSNKPIDLYYVQAEAIDDCGATALSNIIPITVSSQTFSRIVNPSANNNPYIQHNTVEYDGESNDEINELSLNLSPNPARSQVILNTEVGRKGDYTLTLTDLLGKVLISENVNYIKGTNSDVLNVSILPKGVYFVRLTQKEGKASVVQKLIVD